MDDAVLVKNRLALLLDHLSDVPILGSLRRSISLYARCYFS